MRQLLSGSSGPSDADLSDADLVKRYLPAKPRQPWLRANFVASADGAATLAGRSEGLSGAPDKRVFGLLRMICDVLLVGAGTLREESYRAVRLGQRRRQWRQEAGLPEQPVLAVVSSRLALEPEHPALADAPNRPIVITHRGSSVSQRDRLARVADVLVLGDAEVDLAAARDALADRGLPQILCEGGPHLLGSLLAADLVDELCLTLAPLLAGPGADRIAAGPMSPPRQLELAHVLESEGNLMLRYLRAAQRAD
ncbi:MAG: pyrimidine reductase family protein [Micromonosporaceae bacterium]